jgi:predicted AAA+ superfamily ATPase
MKNLGYLKRLSDMELKIALETSGAVLIEGPKWCGKTSTAAMAANSVLYLQNPDFSSSYLALADTQPSQLLKGEVPRLIDEWQMAPVLWDAVRFEVDRRGLLGQFILTGSAVPKDNATAHTGTGRISRMRMRPMSLFESKESTGEISLGALFSGSQTTEYATSSLSIENLAHAICRGGWPSSLKLSTQLSHKNAFDYVEAVINHDISEVDKIDKNPDRVRAIMRSLARNTATMASLKTITEDIEANDLSVSDKTINSYIHALKRIFVVEDLPAWMPSIRSKTAIRTSAKRHFVDPSIATAALRLQANALFNDFEYFGFLFESLCTRDIRIYAQANDGDVFHYRDKNNLESDLIVRLRDGRWAAIEVKMGQKQIEDAAKNLLKLKNIVDTTKMGEPTFLMILTAGEVAYKRKDGVWIVPLGCLRN